MDTFDHIFQILKKGLYALNHNSIQTTTIAFLYEGRYILGIWFAMLFLRSIDSLFFKSRMSNRYGLYAFNCKEFNSSLNWIMYPLLHGNWKHFKNNSIPFLISGSIIYSIGKKEFILSSIIIYIITTISIFLFEKRRGATIGVSGIITGYFGFILLHGFISKTFLNIYLSLLILAFYQRIIFLSLIKQGDNTSNIGHCSGFIAGLFSTFILN